MTGRKVTIGVVGAGAVGQTVAMLLTATDWCARVLISSRTGDSAAALVADLEDLQQVSGSPVRTHAVEVADMGVCHAIVLAPRAAFTNRHERDVRMGGLAANAPVIHTLARDLGGYDGTVIVVTNPVDVLTRLFAETSGCRRTYGVGSHTDSARYRLLLAEHLGVPVDVVDGRVIGEHGDQAVICASTTRVAGMPARVPVHALHAALTDRPQRITAGLGRARAGCAGAVLAALQHTLGLADGLIELSVNHEGTWLGIPLHFTAGQPSVCLPPLSPGEARALAAARAKVRSAYDSLPAHLTEGVPT
ncbi:L-lactate dehydrogenase 2 [Streptomyces mashuensis]|uniref:L-lactate dehydrogenase 2 n=1 Tax=Streptomyces mashuensis TaxID=33904 RepID=A0A919B152_9ACTN|nr:lactate dehydrogenase [Streptomyces mashuensis]GHF33521.1 L-lactate dehydrogenase 2 [Streptomyces mashuensis]